MFYPLTLCKLVLSELLPPILRGFGASGCPRGATRWTRGPPSARETYTGKLVQEVEEAEEAEERIFAGRGRIQIEDTRLKRLVVPLCHYLSRTYSVCGQCPCL